MNTIQMHLTQPKGGISFRSMKLIPFTLMMLLLAGPTWGQTDSKPYSREAAEKSFRALVAAKDTDILSIIKSEGLVCFADSLSFKAPDRFLTIQLHKPMAWIQDTTSNVRPSDEKGSFYDGKTDFPGFSLALLYLSEWENQDSTSIISSPIGAGWHSYGHYERSKNGTTDWKPYSDMPIIFRFSEDKDAISGATDISATNDGTTFYATKKYDNRNGGKTTYEINVRLSTGWYKETWTPDKGEPLESVGNCYKAKEFVRAVPPAKKAK